MLCVFTLAMLSAVATAEPRGGAATAPALLGAASAPPRATPASWPALPGLPQGSPLLLGGARPLAPVGPLMRPLPAARPDFGFSALLKPPWMFVILATVLAWNQTPLFGGI